MNSVSQAITPHACTVDGQTRCGPGTNVDCGDNPSPTVHGNGVCDKSGCDWNPYRLGQENAFGPGSNFTIDSTQKMTVVTQFITNDGTDNGELVAIKRKYVQNGKVIDMSPVSLGGKQTLALTLTLTLPLPLTLTQFLSEENNSIRLRMISVPSRRKSLMILTDGLHVAG